MGDVIWKLSNNILLEERLQYSGQMNQDCSKHGVAEFVNFISNLQISFQIGYVSDSNTSQRLCVCPTVL
jgi:hypothetical protein